MTREAQPLFESSPRKNVHYVIHDNYLRFWFRFVFKYNYMLEIGAYNNLKQIISRDYETYSGIVLEDYFKQLLIESGQYTRIGKWHDRRGENQIDIIAADDLTQRVEFIEVKRQQRNIDLSILRAKADIFMKTTKKYLNHTVIYRGLSLEDI